MITNLIVLKRDTDYEFETTVTAGGMCLKGVREAYGFLDDLENNTVALV